MVKDGDIANEGEILLRFDLREARTRWILPKQYEANCWTKIESLRLPRMLVPLWPVTEPAAHYAVRPENGSRREARKPCAS